MCGFFSIISFKYQDRREELKKVNQAIFHRGPDQAGVLSYSKENGMDFTTNIDNAPSAPFYMLHRRLSILDLSEHGIQPMVSSCGNYAISFNGEVYNFIELKHELESKGVSFRTTTDTEVLLEAYKYWGPDCLPKCVGMFSFIILDVKKQKLFCGRDFFGIKPFYYHYSNDALVIASEPKALLQVSSIPRAVNPQMAYEYLAFGKQEGTKESFFKNLSQLPPAHYIEFSLDAYAPAEAVRYWSIDDIKAFKGSKAEAAAQLKTLFDESVRIHMRSDVEVAANLSGGIDSSSIVMTASRLLADERKLRTISFIPNDKLLSEESWIDIINQESGSHPAKIFPQSKDLIQEMENLIYIQDEPFGSTSAFAQYEVFKQIKELNIKVVLDGQGADELLAGYRGYLFARFTSLLRSCNFIQAFRFGVASGTLPNISPQSPVRFVLGKVRRMVRTPTTKLYMPDFLREDWFVREKISPFSYPQFNSRNSMMEQLKHTFFESSLPHLLRVADRNSMHASVESRVPFLTPDLVKFIFSLPESYIIGQDATTKSVFRDAMQGIVSPKILSRKDKIGFSTPEEKWLKDHKDWVFGVFSSDTARAIPCISAENMEREWNKLLEGDTTFDWRFWRWINFIRWSEIYRVSYS